MQQLKNKRGTTLVELIVCMVLLALFTLAAVTLIQPSAQAYLQVQQLTRAQNLADALIESIRGEVLNANGYIRFTDAGTAADPDSIFAQPDSGARYSDGTALEFSVYPNHIEQIDAGYVPALEKTGSTTALLDANQAAELENYLHMRFYRDEMASTGENAGKYGNPKHTTEDGKPAAYAYTTAYTKDAYMGMYISELHFYARSWQRDSDTDTPRITAMTVVVAVAKKDADGNEQVLCTQKAIVPLPGAPKILYAPGTWDGKAAAES